MLSKWAGMNSTSLLVFSVSLLPHHIYVVEILFVLVFVSYHSRGWDSGFGHLVLEHSPVELLLLEVAHPLLWEAVWNHDVHSSWRKYSVNLTEHLVGIGTRTVPAQDWVEGALVDDSVKGAVFILQTPHIHLFERQVRQLLLVHLLHLLDHSEGDIDVGDVLVTVLVHFLAQAWVAAPGVEDLEGGLHVLSDDILDSWVALVPVKGFLVPKRWAWDSKSSTFDNGLPNTLACRIVP